MKQGAVILSVLGVIILAIAFFRKPSTSASNAVRLVYSPSCPHCKNMMPQWKLLKQEGIAGISVIDVDGTYTPIPGVRGFPTIQRIKNGEVITEYRGERTAEEIRKWALKY